MRKAVRIRSTDHPAGKLGTAAQASLTASATVGNRRAVRLNRGREALQMGRSGAAKLTMTARWSSCVPVAKGASSRTLASITDSSHSCGTATKSMRRPLPVADRQVQPEQGPAHS